MINGANHNNNHQSERPDNFITLETLMPYRDYMTNAQLERYGDYILNIKPELPFTWVELNELRQLKMAQRRE